MTSTNNYYLRAERKIAGRRKGYDYQRISHNQVMYYDAERDCYIHKHHRTKTVFIFRDKFVVDTGGWDTSTTWAKINDWCPAHFGGRHSPSWCDYKYVYWGGRYAAPFYDGIELDLAGAPLDPKPLEVWRMIPGASKSFLALTKLIEKQLGPRCSIGEFNTDISNKPLHGTKLVDTVVEIADWIKDNPGAFVPHELVNTALFAFRPRQSFGRIHRHQEPPPPAERLRSNLTAAYAAWCEDNRRDVRRRVTLPNNCYRGEA